jgi:hypothetical protein
MIFSANQQTPLLLTVQHMSSCTNKNAVMDGELQFAPVRNTQPLLVWIIQRVRLRSGGTTIFDLANMACTPW